MPKADRRKGNGHKGDGHRGAGDLRQHTPKQRANGPSASQQPTEHWKSEPDDHDFPAAHDYLTLVVTERDAVRLVDSLKAAPLVHREAKDLLRASRLPLLTPDNPHVASDLAKVRHGEHLSPVLLVGGNLFVDAPLTIADGYHRICASFHLDENADIPCRLVPFVTAGTASGTPGTAARRAGSSRAGGHRTPPEGN